MRMLDDWVPKCGLIGEARWPLTCQQASVQLRGFFSKKIFWFPMLLKKIFWFWWRKKKYDSEFLSYNLMLNSGEKINILTLVLSGNNFLNETTPRPPCKLNGRSLNQWVFFSWTGFTLKKCDSYGCMTNDIHVLLHDLLDCRQLYIDTSHLCHADEVGQLPWFYCPLGICYFESQLPIVLFFIFVSFTCIVFLKLQTTYK
jgi:hypothetical protein